MVVGFACVLIACFFLLNPSSKTAAIQGPEQATAVVVLPEIDGDHVVVSAHAGNLTVQLLDATSQQEIALLNLPSGASPPIDVVCNSISQEVVVVCEAGDVYLVDATTQTIATLLLADGAAIERASISSGGLLARLDPTNAVVETFDLVTLTENSFTAPSDSVDVAIRIDGSMIAVSTSNEGSGIGNVEIFDSSTLASLGSIGTSAGNGDLEFNSGRIYVAQNDPRSSSRVLVLDPGTGAPSLVHTMESSWGRVRLATGLETLVVFSENSDTLSFHDLASNPTKPELLGEITCVTTPLEGLGGGLPTPAWSNQKKGGPGT